MHLVTLISFLFFMALKPEIGGRGGEGGRPGDGRRTFGCLNSCEFHTFLLLINVGYASASHLLMFSKVSFVRWPRS